MPLIYVTGVSGSGKTTVCRELVARGFKAYDIEKDGLVEWRDVKTHRKLRFPRLHKSLNLHRWYRSHVPYLSLTHVSRLKSKADKSGETIYLCGSAYGEDKAHRYFDVTIALIADLDTLKARIAHRRNTAYGKSADELNSIEKWYAMAQRDYAIQDVVRVDASQPLTTIVQTILDATVNPE